MKLSVIIPTLNEADNLPGTIAAVRERASFIAGGPEIIVSDCGSRDGTAGLARELGARILVDPRLDSRGAALNRGARNAAGDVLLFLDADTILPPGYDRLIQRTLANERVVGGAFELTFDKKTSMMEFIRWVNRRRYLLRRNYYGDQGLFARREAFEKAGGFPEGGLMESAALCRRLRGIGALRLAPGSVITSARRFTEGGELRVFLKDVYLWLRNALGGDNGKFAGEYWDYNRRRGGRSTGPPS